MSAALEHAKNRIRKELDNVLKRAAGHAGGPLSSDVEQLVCNVCESILIHGLLDTFFLKGSRYSKYPEPNIWPFISKFIHGSIQKQITSLKQIKTEIGKSRAWLRIVLNEGSLEHYIQIISSDDNQLSQFYAKSAFLRDSERVETLNGYLKALAKISINAPFNSTVLNNWNPKPLILAGLITEKVAPEKADSLFKRNGDTPSPQLQRSASNDDDERSSVYSHPSMLDRTEQPRQSFQNALPETPEDEQIHTFKEIQRSSDVVVRHKRGRLRSRSKSSNGSSTCISQDLSLTAITQDVEAATEVSQTPPKEELDEKVIFNAIPIEEDNPTERDNREDVTNVEDEDNHMVSAEELNACTFLDDSTFSQTQSMHDELTFGGYQDDSGVSGGNSIQGFIWSSPARRASEGHRSSVSSTSSGPPVISFDAEMRSVLESQQTDETETSSISNFPISPILSKTESSSDTYETLPRRQEFVSTELIIDTRLEEAVVIEDDKDLTDTDEFGVERSLIRKLTKIQNEQGLASQNFRCFSCLKSIGGSSFLPFKVCALDAKYYCEECIRRGGESPIPSRLILNWDIKPRQICRTCKDSLKSIYDRPIIKIDQVNPLLYDNAPQLAQLHKLRMKLSFAATYLLCCKKSVADDLKRRLYPNTYLYADVHRYSIKDLEGVSNGVLARQLTAVTDFAIGHIVQCVLCIQKGFLCEICKSQKVIYPFQVETTHRCPRCFSVYHQQCIRDRECLKCQRKKAQQALDKEVEFVFKCSDSVTKNTS